MRYVMSENDNPSVQTKEAIKKGVNWLANWYKGRCEAGKISSDEYEQAIEKLKHVKIYTSKQGLNRVTEELEKGILHFKPELVEKGATIQMWKNCMARKNTFPLGWCPRNNIEEPVIVIDVEKINERNGDVASTIVHELTHMTADIFDAERNVKKILSGQTTHSQPKQDYNLAHNKKIASVEICPVIVADTNTPLVKPSVNSRQVLTEKASYKNHNFLKDDILFDEYLDKENEVYARIMQLRYKNRMKADTSIKTEDLNKIEYDGNVINRYKEEVVTSILNDVAVISDIKTEMIRDAQSAQASITRLENGDCLPQSSKETAAEQKKNKISDLIVSKHKENFYS